MKLQQRLMSALLVGMLALAAGAPHRDLPDRSPAQSGPCASIHRLKPELELSQRVTFVLAPAYGQTEVTITNCLLGRDGYTQQWNARGFAGSAGFARPGPVYVNSLQTPTGSYSVTEAFGRSNPGTSLGYRELTEDSYWSGREGRRFNSYFEGAGEFPDEPLWRYMQAGDYQQAAVVNYNRAPDARPVHGRSFAIFLHAGLRETWGCISTDLATVEKFLRDTHPGDRIIMGVESELFKALESQR
ncbi:MULTISPECIES: hypothetical protein [unclassified Arthrobacter]|uniref:hypothetical protein n=1 Tax=unclassified Arthrobacter TaxID=235627 RepID=UPI0011B01904|nr:MULTISPECIES: hypothetical protein [unclassified Arthrobacter]